VADLPAESSMVDLPAGRQERWSTMIDEKPCSVYAIFSLTKEYIYVGLAYNAELRIEQHQRGKERTTKPYRPFEILMVEHHRNRQEAREREKYLKSGAGKEFLKELRASRREAK